MGQKLAWQADSRSGTQETRCLNKNIHYHVHKSPQMISAMSQMNPIHSLTSCLIKHQHTVRFQALVAVASIWDRLVKFRRKVLLQSSRWKCRHSKKAASKNRMNCLFAFLIGLLFHPEARGNIFFRNHSKLLPDCTAFTYKKTVFSY